MGNNAVHSYYAVLAERNPTYGDIKRIEAEKARERERESVEKKAEVKRG